jgi:hypothetical protein
MKELNINLGKARRSSRRVDGASYQAGLVAGDRASFGRPVSGADATLRIKWRHGSAPSRMNWSLAALFIGEKLEKQSASKLGISCNALDSLALPREVRDPSKFNGLGKGLGEESTIVFQYILAALPKPSCQRSWPRIRSPRSFAWRRSRSPVLDSQPLASRVLPATYALQ